MPRSRQVGRGFAVSDAGVGGPTESYSCEGGEGGMSGRSSGLDLKTESACAQESVSERSAQVTPAPWRPAFASSDTEVRSEAKGGLRLRSCLVGTRCSDSVGRTADLPDTQFDSVPFPFRWIYIKRKNMI